jgi:16S rRNA (guanine527-N7)-methyltransferase
VFHVKLPWARIEEVIGVQNLDRKSVASVERFCDLLVEANRKINLVSRAGDVADEIERQLLVSLVVLPKLPVDRTLSWIDIGSGGGFPAVPLAIFRSDDHFDLIEAVAKKAFFLERTCQALGLTNVRVVNARVEDTLAKSDTQHDQYDFVSIKAVSGWRGTFSWARTLLLPGGSLLTFKGNPSLSDMSKIGQKFGFEVADCVNLAETQAHVTVSILLFTKV